MPSYEWRAVIIEELRGELTHVAHSEPMEAPDLAAAKRMIDQLVPPSKGLATNALQILEAGKVVGSRIYTDENGTAEWS
jgi:hypothetical protein